MLGMVNFHIMLFADVIISVSGILLSFGAAYFIDFIGLQFQQKSFGEGFEVSHRF